MELAIYVQGHKPFVLNDSNIIYHKYLIGNQNDLDNIDCLHHLFGEYCSMYYVWKNNLHNQRDIVGFCHYGRQIKYQDINGPQLMQSNAFQLFYKQVYSLNINSNLKYNLIESFLSWCRSPQFVIDDLEEFLDTQEIIPQDKLLEYTNTNPFVLHNRNIFITNYEAFCKYAEFIWSYLSLVARKHNIKSKRDWVYHVKDDIIAYYRNLDNSNLRFAGTFWSSQDNFNKIYNEVDWGFGTDCHVWRIYAYIIEYLFSIYVHNQHYFYDVNYTEFQPNFL